MPDENSLPQIQAEDQRDDSNQQRPEKAGEISSVYQFFQHTVNGLDYDFTSKSDSASSSISHITAGIILPSSLATGIDVSWTNSPQSDMTGDLGLLQGDFYSPLSTGQHARIDPSALDPSSSDPSKSDLSGAPPSSISESTTVPGATEQSAARPQTCMQNSTLSLTDDMHDDIDQVGAQTNLNTDSISFASNASQYGSALAAQHQPARKLAYDATEIRQITDASGAIISYGRWHIKPFQVEYADATICKFEYDDNENLIAYTDRSGTRWAPADSSSLELPVWSNGAGRSIEMSVTVVPDGSYQMIDRHGNIETCYTDGRYVTWRPFSPGFDLKRTLFRIFKQIDKNQDSTLTRDELDMAVVKDWREIDDAQLVAMMKTHFYAIQMTRRHAVFRIGSGITIQDILEYDDKKSEEQKKLREVPDHLLKLLGDLFMLVDTNNDGIITIPEIKALGASKPLSADQQHALRMVLNNLTRLHGFSKDGFVDRTEYIQKSDFIKLYTSLYKEQIASQIKTGGWGLEERWEKSSARAVRKLYATENPIDSVKLEAIKQGCVGDCLFLAALGSIVTVCPELIVKSIAENDDSTYTVTFPGDRENPVSVTAPTSVELGLYAHGSQYGVWAPVLEKAHGKHVSIFGAYKSPIPAENFTGGALSYKLFDLLTGQEGTWTYLKNITVDNLSSMLKEAFEQNRASVAAAWGYGSRTTTRGTPIVLSHAYSVVAYDSVLRVITIRNPWGVIATSGSINENPTELLDDGTNGVFTISIGDFHSCFDGVYFEQWKQT